MSDFEEFARSQGFSGDFQRGCNGQYKSDLLHFMEKSFAHQQAKINDLQKTIVSLEAGLRKNSSNKQKLLSKNIEMQKRVDEYEKLTTSIRNEFNLWTDGREFADVIEAQIENLEALRGDHE